MTRPCPWQWWQVRAMEKKPWVSRSSPVPPQVGQARGEVPGLAPEPWHGSQRRALGISRIFSTPKAASSRVSSRWKRTSLPRVRARWRRPAPVACRLSRQAGLAASSAACSLASSSCESEVWMILPPSTSRSAKASHPPDGPPPRAEVPDAPERAGQGVGHLLDRGGSVGAAEAEVGVEDERAVAMDDEAADVEDGAVQHFVALMFGMFHLRRNPKHPLSPAATGIERP